MGHLAVIAREATADGGADGAQPAAVSAAKQTLGKACASLLQTALSAADDGPGGGGGGGGGGVGGAEEEQAEELSEAEKAWRALLAQPDAALGIDSEYTRPGAVALCAELEAKIDHLEDDRGRAPAPWGLGA